MPAFEEARRIILENVAPLGVERVALLESQGRILGREEAAPWSMPVFDCSAMDGYAVRAVDCKEAVVLKVTGCIPAGGAATKPLEPGCAIKIMTGAPIPQGCDAIVPIEEVNNEGSGVRIELPISAGRHIRFAGEDVSAGDTLIAARTFIRPAEIGMLASLGKALVPVYRKPRVAILTTGDELVEIGQPLPEYGIFDSNALSLAGAVKEAGAIPSLLGIARDDTQSHKEKMLEGLTADALITSAGVSAGDHDLVREVLNEIGVTQLFRHIDMKPGGPTAFGLYGGRPVFSLPGNPVSSMISFEELVRPALLKMAGHRRVIRPLVKAVLQHKVEKKPGKIFFLRVRLSSKDGRYVASSAGDQHTAILSTMLRADAVALLPAARTSFDEGEEVDVHTLSPLEMLVD